MSLFKDLYHKLINAEERPVVTRFFLFAPCVNALLTAKLIGLPSSVFDITSISLNAKSKGRLSKFVSWNDDSATLDRLKVASLALQITEHATSFTAKKHAAGEVAAQQNDPNQHMPKSVYAQVSIYPNEHITKAE